MTTGRINQVSIVIFFSVFLPSPMRLFWGRLRDKRHTKNKNTEEEWNAHRNAHPNSPIRSCYSRSRSDVRIVFWNIDRREPMRKETNFPLHLSASVKLPKAANPVFRQKFPLSIALAEYRQKNSTPIRNKRIHSDIKDLISLFARSSKRRSTSKDVCNSIARIKSVRNPIKKWILIGSKITGNRNRRFPSNCIRPIGFSQQQRFVVRHTSTQCYKPLDPIGPKDQQQGAWYTNTNPSTLP